MDLQQDGYELLEKVKRDEWFPFKTGNLKHNATGGYMIDNNTYCIEVNCSVAPYAEYLETGTSPHDIPNAFGRDFPFGIGGRFEGKFHPGSKKHKGWISEWLVGECVIYFIEKYGGELR